MDNVEYLKASLVETRQKYKLVKKRMKALEKILREKGNRKRRENINPYKPIQIIENKNQRSNIFNMSFFVFLFWLRFNTSVGRVVSCG